MILFSIAQLNATKNPDKNDFKNVALKYTSYGILSIKSFQRMTPAHPQGNREEEMSK